MMIQVIINGYWYLAFPVIVDGQLKLVPYMGLNARCFWWPPYDSNKLLPSAQNQ